MKPDYFNNDLDLFGHVFENFEAYFFVIVGKDGVDVFKQTINVW